MKKKIKIFFENIAVFILAFGVRLLRFTYRVEYDDRSGLLKTDKVAPLVGTLWHNRLLFSTALLPTSIRKQFCTIASLSNDGRLAAKFIENFGMEAVRGSSSRGGRQALLALQHKLAIEGKPLAITIDGPRGPRYGCKPGAVFLATHAKCPIQPFVVNASKYFEFKNWDKTQIPKPFSKVKIIIGERFYLDAALSVEENQQKIITAMLAITKDN